ncbi:MAG: four-carbon acid sugar kinase family protein [Sheuella sp.]|jgi:uncharacterized protein YgbK (DUF1537 family)|nr:four-carbon acid sugar kinase family protein [Sheuella sp.]
MKKILLGCIADDFTGATDLANNLVRSGMRVVQTIGVPATPLDAEVDAVVVSLKSRTIAPGEAAAQSVKALEWLQAQGAQQIYFKYCSTFDSTAQGNIGPVTDALMAAMGVDFTIATPAFPDAGRTVFKGYLFVGDVLLHESGMQDHPLTPMTDPNLVRVLQAQTKHKVGLIDYKVIGQGAQAIGERMTSLREQGVGIAIVDAVSNADLVVLGAALKNMPLVTAGSGVAIGLPGNFGIAPNPESAALPKATGLKAIVSGSCSRATNLQVADFVARGLPAFVLDPLSLLSGDAAVLDALKWAESRLAAGPVLIYSTAAPEALKRIQDQLGVQQAGELVEQALASIAKGLVALGVGQLVVAGGETSGAVVQALGMHQLQIGAQIDPGVPWCAANGMHITLKSGNFGTPDFFTKAFDHIA